MYGAKRPGSDLQVARACVAGFAANALGLLTFIFLLYLCLAVSWLFYTAIDQAARARVFGGPAYQGSVLQFVVASLGASLRNAVAGVWSARLGFVVFGVLGALAACTDEVGRLFLRKERVWLSSFVCMMAIVAVSIITWAFAQREEVAAWIAGRPETYSWRHMLLRSYALDIGVSLIFAAAVSYPIWAVWQWWYRLLRSRLLARAAPEELEARATEAAFMPLQEALPSGRLVRPLAILFVLCAALAFPLNRYHDQVAMRLQHGVVFTDTASQLRKAMPVRVEPGIRRIRVVNINGVGTVGIYLSPTDDYAQAVKSVRGWTFEWRSDEYLYVDVPVTDLQPGDYYLHFVQESGWGYYEYTLSAGGGMASHLSALVLGFLLALAVLSGIALAAALAVWALGRAETRRG